MFARKLPASSSPEGPTPILRSLKMLSEPLSTAWRSMIATSTARIY